MAESEGFEPPHTFGAWLPLSKRTPYQTRSTLYENGQGGKTRTSDIRYPKPELYQLSYTLINSRSLAGSYAGAGATRTPEMWHPIRWSSDIGRDLLDGSRAFSVACGYCLILVSWSLGRSQSQANFGWTYGNRTHLDGFTVRLLNRSDNVHINRLRGFHESFPMAHLPIFYMEASNLPAACTVVVSGRIRNMSRWSFPSKFGTPRRI